MLGMREMKIVDRRVRGDGDDQPFCDSGKHCCTIAEEILLSVKESVGLKLRVPHKINVPRRQHVRLAYHLSNFHQAGS